MAEQPSHFSFTDPQFLSRAFLHVLESQREHPLVQLFDIPNEVRLSFFFDVSGIQESIRFRALNRARRLSIALIDEKGEVKRDFLLTAIALLEKEGFLFYPNGTSDSLISEHILRCLRTLNNEEIIKSLKRFQKPLVHKWAEMLILETLGIHTPLPVSDAQIRAAVICACLTPLRQNVGSCFATAPAILIQSDQMALMLDDLYQLLSTGKLKRTFGGVEYAIPLSPSTGMGELKKKLKSEDLRVKTGFCPGLIAALEVAGLLDFRRSIEEKGEAVQSLIEEFSREKRSLTIEDFIRRTLLRKFGLSEEEVEKARGLEMAQFKSSKMTIGMTDSGISRKLDRISTFQQKEKECRAAFKGICDNALLRAWEFTIASFSEVKMEFSRWNLYSSLGLAPQEVGGIGEVISRQIEEKINELNAKLQEYQAQYEIAFDQVRTTETLLRSASSESDARRLQAEYQSRAYHMRSCLEMRDAVYSKGSNYSNLFAFLIKQYDEKFPEYFQEIYDAEMQGFQGDIYDDSPAGFRLVYKHGRPDPSLWTLIYNADQYIDALLDFFSATESQIAAACDWEGGDRDVLELTSAIILHLRSNIFLETALQRMAKVHHHQALEKKPWAYTSGGTMTTLIKTYYCRESEPTQEAKWVENESELLIFILDTLKSLPHATTDPYLKNLKKGMLMTSPTHAFVLLPAQEGFRQGWQDDIFTYTWVRDEMFLPSQRFYSQMKLSLAEQAFLFSLFCDSLPSLLVHHLHQTFLPQEKTASVIEWRNQLLKALIRHSPVEKQSLADRLDAFLYQTLPLAHGKEWKVSARRILSDLMSENIEHILQRFPDAPAPFLTARELCDIAKGCYLLAASTICFPFDPHQHVARHARFVGAAPPTPLLFADTNWAGNDFGFVVNPGTGRLELWRLDRTLSQGMPMSSWKQWLNGSDPKTWSVFTRPHEYEMGVPSFAMQPTKFLI